MAGISATDGGATARLSVREPRQRRTREQWDRILDAGLALLEEGGYEAFTIAALCDRAGVPPRALYARADSKDALFLVVYEHGMRRVLASERSVERRETNGLDLGGRIEAAVLGLVRVFADHADFLRAVVLVSGAHPEVRRRGEAYRAATGRRFIASLDAAETSMTDEAVREREFCFDLLFSALVVRTTYGPGFAPTGDPEALAHDLVTVARRYLLPGAA